MQMQVFWDVTYSIVQSPSWKANWFAASQEIPRISRNPKVHYRTHKRPPPVPILGQPNPVHIPTSHLLEIHPNIIHPSTPRSPQWSLSSGFPTKNLYTPLLTHTRHMPSPSHFWDVTPYQIVVFTNVFDESNVFSQMPLTLREISHTTQGDLIFQPQRAANLKPRISNAHCPEFK